ncbi:biotin transporter BioY [Candidatus Woesearchaeota archaeon]|nr:biotin transporter BioY [Candidatus Woesearchaeota archaeon]
MEKSKLKGMVFAALFAAFTAAVAWFKIPLPFTPVPITLQTLAVLLSGAMLGSVYGALSMIIYLAVGTLGLPVFAGGSSGIGALLGPTGGYLFSYPLASFVIGKMLEKKKLSNFLKYFSFAVIIVFVVIVLFDALFKVGIMKLWDKASNSYISMISLISQQQRIILIAISVVVLVSLLLLIFYLKKSKTFSIDTILAMFAGTLVIYILGSIQGKFVTGLPWNAIFVGWVLPFIIGDTLKLLLAAYMAKNIDIRAYMK